MAEVRHRKGEEAGKEVEKKVVTRERKKKGGEREKKGVVDYVCVAIRLMGAACFLFWATTLIYFCLPLRMFNFVWRRLGFVNNYPLDFATKMWARGLFRVIGGEAIVETSNKIPIDEPTIMMYSHTSFYDPVIIGSYAPITAKYIFKKELLFLLPYIFIAAIIAGHVPINRSKRHSAISSLQQAAYAVKENHRTIVISPEGTRSLDGTLQPFKKGPFHLAADAGVKHVIPIVIFGAYELWPTKQMLPEAGTMRVHYLDPVSTAHTTLETLSDKVRNAMLKEIERVDRLKLHPRFLTTKSRNLGPALMMLSFTAAVVYCFYCWYYSLPLYK